MAEVERWERKHVPTPAHVPPWFDGALAEHFAAIHELLEKAGHRPFGRLELRMPGQSFECDVVYRWSAEVLGEGHG